MSVKLLTEHHLEFLSLKRGSSESTLVLMPHCWKSQVMAHFLLISESIEPLLYHQLILICMCVRSEGYVVPGMFCL